MLNIVIRNLKNTSVIVFCEKLPVRAVRAQVRRRFRHNHKTQYLFPL